MSLRLLMVKTGHWRNPGRLQESAEAIVSEGTSQKTYGNGAAYLRVSRFAAPILCKKAAAKILQPP